MTATTADLATMLRAVLIDPADGLARLAYADALEEAGQAGRAEFVRVQVELTGVVCHHPEAGPGGFCDDSLCRHCSLDRRGHEIEGGGHTANPGWADHAERFHRLPAGFIAADPLNSYRVRRGFVESISLPLAAFMEHAEALFASHPITAVTLTDRVPNYTAADGFLWATNHRLPGKSDFDRYPHWLPKALRRHLYGRVRELSWGHIHRYDTPEAAAEDASRACIAYGRERAGLPPLRA